MYYACNNKVGTGAPPADGIAITPEEYQLALENMRAGNLVRVVNGALTFVEPAQPGRVYLLDEGGFYAGSSDGAPDGSNYVLFEPPAALLRPKWMDGEWIEGASADEIETKRIQDIKDKARETICARLPDWKQANLIARAVELTEKRASGQELTTEEEAELDDCKAEWEWVKAVRARSDVAEAQGEQPDEIDWPTFEHTPSA